MNISELIKDNHVIIMLVLVIVLAIISYKLNECTKIVVKQAADIIKLNEENKLIAEIAI